jgi:hypothetical protein
MAYVSDHRDTTDIDPVNDRDRVEGALRPVSRLIEPADDRPPYVYAIVVRTDNLP